MTGFLQRQFLRRSTGRWARLADEARSLPVSQLRELMRDAGRLRLALDRLSMTSQARFLGMDAAELDCPDQCDWSWRPDPWRQPMELKGVVSMPSPHQLSEHVTLFHDCSNSEITLRQIAALSRDRSAPYGLCLEVYRFDGSFLSLVLSPPDDKARGLSRNHYLSLSAKVSREHPIEIYARLNVQHGPNTEQMVRLLEFEGESGLAEFDLAYSKINEKRVERMWIDLIFENPQMNQIALHDLTLTRAPRADL